VFANPDCQKIEPANEFSAEQWTVLGIGKSRTILDYISLDEQQLSEDELLARWNEYLSDIVIFSNIQEGGLRSIYCADGSGIKTDRYVPSAIFGKEYIWNVRDARDIAKNAVWVIEEYRDPDDPQFYHEMQYLVDLEAQTDPYFAVVAAAMPNCSLERGEKFLERYADDLS
jgi:hypothetical protein